jgi:hypothetical protein
MSDETMTFKSRGISSTKEILLGSIEVQVKIQEIVDDYESCILRHQESIAKLEKENKLLKKVEQIFNDSPDLEFSLFKDVFPEEYEAHNLEQQIEGVMDYEASLSSFPYDAEEYCNKLREEAKR